MKQRKLKTKICEYCGLEYETRGNSSKYCCRECQKLHVIEKRYANGVEGVDYVVCKWCGMRVGRIYGKHMKKFHPDKTSSDYKAEFPGAPLMSSNDVKETTKNGGKHMRQQKYRDMASRAMRGDMNPNHKSNTDELSRKKISPFSIEFYRERYPGLTEPELERMRFDKMNSAIAKRVLPSQPLYWITRGYTEDEAREKVAEHQRTFTLAKLIVKYGEEKGKHMWNERQRKWKEKVYNKNTCISGGNSETALLMFDLIRKEYLDKTILYDNNEKVMHDGNRPYKYDFCIVETRKIIEFNGTYWHCDPRKYDADYYHTVKNLTAREIWEYDEYKRKLAEKHGYSVLYVWEADYAEDPNGTIKKCMEFLDA